MKPTIAHYTRNLAGRDYVVGDIHGCFELLATGLIDRAFNADRDRLFSVGDLVDRGARSAACLDWLDKPWFHAVRGNHEQMAIGVAAGHHSLDNYIRNGGAWFAEMPADEQARYAQEFDKLPLAIEIETAYGLIGIVHAECPCTDWVDFTAALSDPDVSNNRMDRIIETALWSRTRMHQFNRMPVANIHTIFVGHTPVEVSIALGNVQYIDTGAVFGGKLTIAQVSP